MLKNKGKCQNLGVMIKFVIITRKKVTSKRRFKLHNRKKKFRNKQGDKSRKFGEASVVETNQADGELLVVFDADSRAW